LRDAAATEFDEVTIIRPLAAGRFRAELAAGWRVGRAANGGYLAALLVRAAEQVVADPSRRVRSLSVHYLRAARAGPAQIECLYERRGRSLSAISLRMEQNREPVCLALAACMADFPSGLEHDAARAPRIPPPSELAAVSPEFPLPEYTHGFDYRFAPGGELLAGGQKAQTGGWMRLREGRSLDAPLVALFADAWLPALFAICAQPMAVPTLDLTIHFRRNPAQAVTRDGFVQTQFSSRLVADGFWEEDGWIWDGDRRLIAHSRQLALARPLRRDSAMVGPPTILQPSDHAR
jgi:acyl-CoA thioesterase